MMIGQGDNASGQHDALGAFARCGEEHLGRCDHFPAAGVVFTAPEFVVAELVQALDEIEIAAELQHRMLADWMMRGEEGAEAETWHGLSLLLLPIPIVRFRPRRNWSTVCAGTTEGRSRQEADWLFPGRHRHDQPARASVTKIAISDVRNRHGRP